VGWIDPCDQEFEVDRDAGKMDISMGKAHVVVVVVKTADVQKCAVKDWQKMQFGRANVTPAIASFVFPSDMNYGCVRDNAMQDAKGFCSENDI